MKEAEREDEDDSSGASTPVENTSTNLDLNETTKEESSNNNKKVFNCSQCAHMFLAQEPYKNHLKDVHKFDETAVQNEVKKKA